MSAMRTVKKNLFARYGQKCEMCGKKFPVEKLTGHHIHMKSRGGDITEDNILILCYNCHFGTVNHTKYDSAEYWELMSKCLAHRNNVPP